MFRKITALFLVFLLLTGSTGCEAVRRKFTRKKVAKPVRPMFYREEEGQSTTPPIELYMTHYVYWKTWMDDLITNAGKNEKRDKRAAAEAIGNLMDMKKYLAEEKKSQLEPYIDEITKIADTINRGNLNEARIARIKQELDKIKRRVVRKFYYKKVREYIITGQDNDT